MRPPNRRHLAALREEYTRGGLDEADLDPDPVDHARSAGWTRRSGRALRAQRDGPLDRSPRPASRRRAWCCSRASTPTGSSSSPTTPPARARSSPARPACALLLPVAPARSARSGSRARRRRLPDEEGDAYFAGRPARSQLGAWASPQSKVGRVARAARRPRYAEAGSRFADGPVARPPYWGGYRVVPDTVEFWQGRPGPAARPVPLPVSPTAAQAVERPWRRGAAGPVTSALKLLLRGGLAPYRRSLAVDRRAPVRRHHRVALPAHPQRRHHRQRGAKGDTGYIVRTGAVMLAVALVQVALRVAAVWFAARTAMAFGRDVRAATSSTASARSRPARCSTSAPRRSSPARPTTSSRCRCWC